MARSLNASANQRMSGMQRNQRCSVSVSVWKTSGLGIPVRSVSYQGQNEPRGYIPVWWNLEIQKEVKSGHS